MNKTKAIIRNMDCSYRSRESLEQLRQYKVYEHSVFTGFVNWTDRTFCFTSPTGEVCKAEIDKTCMLTQTVKLWDLQEGMVFFKAEDIHTEYVIINISANFITIKKVMENPEQSDPIFEKPELFVVTYYWSRRMEFEDYSKY